MDQANARKRRRQQTLLYLTGGALAVALVVLVAAMLLLQQQARRAADEVGCSRVEELTLAAPLVLTPDAAVQVQVSVGAADAAGRRSVAIFSRLEGSVGTPWLQHASGVLGSGACPARGATTLTIAATLSATTPMMAPQVSLSMPMIPPFHVRSTCSKAQHRSPKLPESATEPPEPATFARRGESQRLAEPSSKKTSTPSS